MAEYLTTDTDLTSVANAIRAKGGTSASLTFPADFVSAIENIPTASAPVLQAKTVVPTTSPETVTADSGYDGLSSVTIQLPVYNGELEQGYTVQISLTNPNHDSGFVSFIIYELLDENTVGNEIGRISSATGTTMVTVEGVYGIRAVLNGKGVHYYYSNIAVTGGVSLIIPDDVPSSSAPIDFVVANDGTIAIDRIDWDF